MSSKLNISGLYNAVEKSRIQAFESAKADSLNRLNQSQSAIDASYRSNVTSAQTASRISSLGQEEKLAASGLSFGSGYSAATTGYTETSRVAQDNTLRSNLNSLSAARTKAVGEAQNQYSSEVAQAEQEKYQAVADVRLQKAQAKIDYSQKKYENALSRWQTYGYVLPADAKTLGVKAGTKSSAKAYNDAKLALERLKALS